MKRMNKTDIYLRLVWETVKNSLSRAFKIESFQYPEDHNCIAMVKFINGIIWRCILSESSEVIDYRSESRADVETVIVKSELIECDIKKACYEIFFYRTSGELIYRSKETISPTGILKDH